MKVYVSSTWQDLALHRGAVDRALRRMRHDVIGMEQYVAEGRKPLARCTTDVRAADVLVLILAWRYGYVPIGDDNPDGRSITELEFEAALAEPAKPVLAFLVDPDAAWPAAHIDALRADPTGAENILRFRGEVGAGFLAGMFTSPDDLASQVAAAVASQGRGRQLLERRLFEASVNADAMGAFGGGGALGSTTVAAIKEMVATAGTTRAIIVDVEDGQRWWSTRLYLLASLLRSVTGVQQLVFRRGDGRFLGMATPNAVADGLADAYPVLGELERRLRAGDASEDTQQETDRQLTEWGGMLGGAGWNGGQAIEDDLKVHVRPQLLSTWFRERYIDRCIRVDETGLDMTQVQQIVDSLLPDVPVERVVIGADDVPRPQIIVVDRDAFALELARDWVHTGLPRTPVM